MKRTIVQIIFFIYCIANVYPQYSTIWQLGKTDNSSKEFALAPDGKIDLLSPALEIIKIFLCRRTHTGRFSIHYTGAYSRMGWFFLLGRTMQDTTSYFNKTIRCQSAKEISMEYFYRECRIRRLYVLKTGSQRKELRFSYKA